MIGMSRRFMRDWRDAQVQDQSVRMMGTRFNDRPVGMFVDNRTVVVNVGEFVRNRDVDQKEIESGKHWLEHVCVAKEDSKECVICQEEEMTSKCENPVMELVAKLGETCKDLKGVPWSVKTGVSMNCCSQTVHVGCVLSWWCGKKVWTCPYCRAVHSKTREEEEKRVITQIVDAVTRTIWDVAVHPSEPVVISDDDEEEEDDRYDFDSVDEDTLEHFISSFSH